MEGGKLKMLRPFGKEKKAEMDEFEEQPIKQAVKKVEVNEPPEQEEPQNEPSVDSGEVIAAIEYHLNKAYQLLQAFK